MTKTPDIDIDLSQDTDGPSTSTYAPPREGYFADAQPFREHVFGLMRDTGLHWRLIAALGGIAPSAMNHLLHGRTGRPPKTIHNDLARLITNLDPDELTTANRRRTYAGNSRSLLQALAQLGYTHRDLSPWLTQRDLRVTTHRSLYCTLLTEAKIQACYDLLTSPEIPALPHPQAAAS